MKIYKVKYSNNVIEKIDDLIDFITSINTRASSNRYALDIYDEISNLSYLADILPELIWKTPSIHHNNTKRLLIKKGKLTVFFHTYKDYVIVDDIVPSKMVTIESDL